MTTVTHEELAVIVAKQDELSKLIQGLKAGASVTVGVPEATITLKPGEHYAGLVLDETGKPSHHLILLPGDQGDLNWEAAKAWAGAQGGELPTRQEQALLFANLKGKFEGAWYWSAQQHEKESGWAWCQTFHLGDQSSYHEHDEFRARAVRRLVIE